MPYLFFYRNFIGGPFYWSFDHIWSLCVEEHFYFFFPLLLILIRMIRKPTIKGMYVIAFAMIVGGFIIKMLIYKYTNSQDTYSASYNRLDQFGYGILLFLLLNIRQWRPKEYFWIPSAIMIAILIYLDIILSNKLIV